MENPDLLMDDLGVFPTIFGNIHIMLAFHSIYNQLVFEQPLLVFF